MFFAATGCHGECCTKPDSEEIRAEVFSDILIYFWNVVFKFKEQIYGKGKTNYYRRCSFLTSEGKRMGE